ncbi:uncharacterized protein LOC124899607 [Capsicum annuum]|uniref:uncharacterized protein LOC124899607 n=1 Tax=Capsicum annuum TaxID=4072 RepID=UPI001FB118BE|nr:uncharacterized protein LOC124899607 [Capsicum annuum]
MFFDEAKNFKGVGIGAVLVSEIGQHYPISTKIRFPCTNNMAKYEACILGLRMAADMDIKELLVIGDSDLLIHQVQGEWTTKNVKIFPYVQCVKELSKRFTKIEFKHVLQIQNEFVDALETLSSMIQHPDKNYIDLIKVEIHSQQVYYFYVDEEPDGKPWYYDIKRLLRVGEYPEGATEATRLLEEIHAETCGPHMNDFMLAKKILRAGYFWMTMKRDNIQFVQKCHQCQVHGDFIRVPPNKLNVMGSPWPFAAWGMDVIGTIDPPASNGHHFIWGAINYFVNSIITDNGANLNSNQMREICERFKISHQNSTAYRPQMDRAVKAANKNIKRILRKIVDGNRKWHEKLPYALLGYRTTIRTSTGATFYMLVYGSKAVIPAKVEIPSLRVIQEVDLDDAERICSRIEQLMLIDEKRLDAVYHGHLYQNRMIKAFNKKVKPRRFTPGELVLKNPSPR